MMDDLKDDRTCSSPEVCEDGEQMDEQTKCSLKIRENIENKKDENKNDNNSVLETDSDKLFHEPVKEKLRFGIEAILNEKEGRHKKNKHVNIIDKDDSEKTRALESGNVDSYQRQLTVSYMDALLSKDDDDDVDDENDGFENENDFKNYKFDLEVARARLTYMGYSASFSPSGIPEQGGISLQQSFSPPFPVNSTGYPWSAVGDLRKDRFPIVRRIGHPYQNRTPPKRKKPRTSFTRLQILELEKRFERQKYLASTERSALAKTLKMTDAQVKTWFQNRRTKWRRQTAEEREIERQAANRLLLSLQSDTAHRKSMVMSPESVCLSHLQRWQEKRTADI